MALTQACRLCQYLILTLMSLQVVFAQARVPYVVFPTQINNVVVENGVTAALNARNIPVLLFSKAQGLGVFAWKVNMLPADITAIQASPYVLGVFKDDPGPVGLAIQATDEDLPVQAQNDGWQLDNDAADDLKFVSQPPNIGPDITKTYMYDRSAGRGELVYVVDTGAYLDHVDFANVRANARWLYARPDLRNTPGDFMPRGHGTAMLSKITGARCGVSKNVSPVIVRVPSLSEGGDGAYDWVFGMVQVYNDFVARRLATPALAQRGAVVNLAFTLPVGPDFVQVAADYMKTLVRSMIDDLGLFVVTGSGNDNGKPVNGYPALLGGGANPINELLILSGLDKFGVKWAGAQTAPWVRFGAPGLNVLTASTIEVPPGQGYNSQGRGTSEASAMGAGLAAYFKALSSCQNALLLNAGNPATGRQRVAALKTIIENLAWARTANDPRGIWNGANPLRQQDQVPGNCGSGWVSVAAAAGNASDVPGERDAHEAEGAPLVVQDAQLDLRV